MIQGCVDYKDHICPIANECLRRVSAKCAPKGVTVIISPYNKDTNKCEYFIGKRGYDTFRDF